MIWPNCVSNSGSFGCISDRRGSQVKFSVPRIPIFQNKLEDFEEVKKPQKQNQRSGCHMNEIFAGFVQRLKTSLRESLSRC